MAVLIDTSFLVAIASKRDTHHRTAMQAIDRMHRDRIVPAPVLPELFYMLKQRVDYSTAMSMFASLRSGLFHIENLTAQDMSRMQIIMEQYADNEFDFVDTAIMALSERLNVAEIYSFDQRDFRVFRPVHRPYLRILP